MHVPWCPISTRTPWELIQDIITPVSCLPLKLADLKTEAGDALGALQSGQGHIAMARKVNGGMAMEGKREQA